MSCQGSCIWSSGACCGGRWMSGRGCAWSHAGCCGGGSCLICPVSCVWNHAGYSGGSQLTDQSSLTWSHSGCLNLKYKTILNSKQ